MNNILFIILGIIIVIVILFVVKNIHYSKQKSIDNNFQKISNNFTIEHFDGDSNTYFDDLRLKNIDPDQPSNGSTIYDDIGTISETPGDISLTSIIKSSARKIRPESPNTHIANTKFLHIFTLVKLSGDPGSSSYHSTTQSGDNLNQVLIDYLNNRDKDDVQGYMLKLTKSEEEGEPNYIASNLAYSTNEGDGNPYGSGNGQDMINILSSIGNNIYRKKDLGDSKEWALSINHSAGKFYHLLLNCRYIMTPGDITNLKTRIESISLADDIGDVDRLATNIMNAINVSDSAQLYNGVNFCGIMAGLTSSNNIYTHMTNEFMTFLAELLYSKIYDAENDNFGFVTSTRQISLSDALTIDFKEYLSLVFSLVKLRKIFKENNYAYLKDYNEKYLTFLFYSFNRGKDIFENTLTNLKDANQSELLESEKNIILTMFNVPQFEGLYKLFIISLKQPKYKLYYEYNNDKDKLEAFTLNPDNIELNKDFNIRQYFFYDINRIIGGAQNCMLIQTNDGCTANKNCYWNTQQNICKPAQCIGSTDVPNSTASVCKTGAGRDSPDHCLEKDIFMDTDRIEEKEIYFDSRCYDASRVMYIEENETYRTLPDTEIDHNYLNYTVDMENYYLKRNTHLSRCMYKKSDGSVVADNDACKGNCKFAPNQQHDTRKDDIKFKQCVTDELMDPSYYSCGDYKIESHCDGSKNLNYDSTSDTCFWQDGKCHPRTAPQHWRNIIHRRPDPSNTDPVNTDMAGISFAMGDTMDCGEFNSQYTCPEERCVWLYNTDRTTPTCIRKEDHPAYGATPAFEGFTGSSNAINKGNVNCEAINSNSNDRETECKAFGCKWENNRCKSLFHENCSLKDTINRCIGEDNYDPNTNSNKCKWITKEGGKSDGRCMDSDILEPCASFNEANCPTDSKPKRDLYGNIIPGTSHCVLEDGDCRDKTNSLTPKQIEQMNDCRYKQLTALYTGTSETVPDNCQENPNINPGGNIIPLWVNKTERPCSMLNVSEGENECQDPDIVGSGDDKICYYKEGSCKPSNTLSEIDSLLDTLTGDNYYDGIKTLTDKLENIQRITQKSRSKFFYDVVALRGNIIRVTQINSDTAILESGNDNLNKLSLGDDIKLYNRDGNLLASATIKNIDLIENKITIYSSSLTSISTSIEWLVREPNIGLFNSIQNSNAIIDSMKIADFYENY